MNILKKQRGSITIITLITVLFILAFVLGNFAIVVNRKRIQEDLIYKTINYNYCGKLVIDRLPTTVSIHLQYQMDL